MNSYNYTTPYATSQMMHYNHVSPTSPVSPQHPLNPANPIQHMETPANTPVPEEVYDANDMLIGIFVALIIGFILGRLL